MEDLTVYDVVAMFKDIKALKVVVPQIDEMNVQELIRFKDWIDTYCDQRIADLIPGCDNVVIAVTL